MKSWKEVGLVHTIYEEEYEHSSSSPSLSPSNSSPSTPLRSRVESWSLATGQKPDVSIYVQGTCFLLHKGVLASRSGYLKRQLRELSQITLPLNITTETFSLVADFCYGTQISITPFNIAALRTAAELLDMTATNGKRDQNLRQVTETYFGRVVTVNRELALIVFRSCLRLLPEAETTAFLVSRCFEALNLTEDSDHLDGCLDDVINLRAEEFQIIAESMQCSFASHDTPYRIIDLYVKEHMPKITEEQKAEICNCIDCDKLSPQILMHAVQNPRMPLRLIVRAMLLEQLNTRHAILTIANNHHNRRHQTKESMTLGSILRRDAAVREAAELKSEMEATNSRIESLEKELAGMKELLQKSEKLLFDSAKERRVMDPKTEKILHEPAERDGRSVMESSRSASFHYASRDANKIERGEKGSISFASFRFGLRGERTEGSSLSKLSCNGSQKPKKNDGKGLINRLKTTLRVSKSASRCPPQCKPSSKEEEDGVTDDEDVIVNNEVASFHNRHHSLG